MWGGLGKRKTGISFMFIEYFSAYFRTPEIMQKLLYHSRRSMKRDTSSFIIHPGGVELKLGGS